VHRVGTTCHSKHATFIILQYCIVAKQIDPQGSQLADDEAVLAANTSAGRPNTTDSRDFLSGSCIDAVITTAAAIDVNQVTYKWKRLNI
jgi:hypothetical protein